MITVRVEFRLSNLLDGTYAYADSYSITCLYAECTRKRADMGDSVRLIWILDIAFLIKQIFPIIILHDN